MIAYFIYLFVISIQWVFIFVTQGSITNRCKKNFLILACIELVVLAGIRGYGVGADTEIYLSALDYYSSLTKAEALFAKLVWPYDFEIGYFLLTKICAWLGTDKTVFLFLIAIITYVPIFTAMYKYSSDPYISILTYFAVGLFGYSLGIFRQMIAVSIVLCGIKFIENRKFWKYLLLVLFAMTFHKTALLALVLYFLYPIKWRTNAKLGFVGCIAAIVAGRPIILLIIRLFPSYLSYVGSKYDVTDTSYLMIVVWLALWVGCCFLNKQQQQVTQVNKIAFDALSFALIVQVLGYHMGILGRVIGYLSIYCIFLMPNVLNIFDKKSRVVANMILVVVLFVMIVMQLNAERIQYVTCWS